MDRSFHHLVPLENDPVEANPHFELKLLIFPMTGPTKKTRSRNPTRPKGHTSPRSYTPVSDALKQSFSFADTELAEGISRHALVGLLAGALSRKRRHDGEPLGNILCALLTWPNSAAASAARTSAASRASKSRRSELISETPSSPDS